MSRMRVSAFSLRRCALRTAIHSSRETILCGCMVFSLTVLPVVRALQLRHVELPHAEHRLHDALRAGRVLVLQPLAENRRDDLPRHAELVLQPATALDLAAGRKLVPQLVD